MTLYLGNGLVASHAVSHLDVSATTWYQPLEDQRDIDTAVHWALGRPGIFVITTGDVNVLPKFLDAAERYAGQAPADTEMETMVKRLEMEPLFV